ncbi:hypothetical protein M8C21_010372, partial [Ambrosia artemisiifolia]
MEVPSIDMLLYTGGSFKRGYAPGDAVYTAYNGDTIATHLLNVPLNFTCSVLHDHVRRAAGSSPFYLSYKLPMEDDDPDVTFHPIAIRNDQDLELHFKDHVRMQIELGKPVELYHM